MTQQKSRRIHGHNKETGGCTDAAEKTSQRRREIRVEKGVDILGSDQVEFGFFRKEIYRFELKFGKIDPSSLRSTRCTRLVAH